MVSSDEVGRRTLYLIDSSSRLLHDFHRVPGGAVGVGDPVIYDMQILSDDMRGPQDFRRGHPTFLICQLIKPLQRMFQIIPSNQLLHIFFWILFSQR